MGKYSKWVVTLINTVVSGEIYAEGQTYGDIAQNLFNQEIFIRSILRAICIITGSGLILGSLLQYKRHRQNPIEVPLSTVFLSFAAGVALIGLSFIPFQF